jgi:hypothetical protein
MKRLRKVSDIEKHNDFSEKQRIAESQQIDSTGVADSKKRRLQKVSDMMHKEPKIEVVELEDSLSDDEPTNSVSKLRSPRTESGGCDVP